MRAHARRMQKFIVPRGFFASVLIVVVASIMLVFVATTMQANAKLDDASISAIELEQVSFLRYQVEENIASVIKETLMEELEKENTDSLQLNLAVSEKIKGAFEIFRDRFGCDIYITDGFTKSPLQNLHELSRVIVVDTGQGLYAEYVFTGGLLKDKKLVCKLQRGQASALAVLMPGYTIALSHVK